MKLFTKESDYAVRALAFLARKNKKGEVYISSRLISAEEKIPLVFLRRLLQILVKNRLVVSQEGVAGGVKLAADPKKISVAAVMRMIQGDIRLVECMFRKKICANRGKCVLRKKMQKIEAGVIREFESINIADLVDAV